MPLATRIDGFSVRQSLSDGMWEATCSHTPETFVFLDLPNALFGLAQYDFCDHPAHNNWIHKYTPRIYGFPVKMRYSDFIFIDYYSEV